MIICTQHLFFCYTFRMFDQNEKVEILVENELSVRVQPTSPETNIKQKDKPEKKRNIQIWMIKRIKVSKRKHLMYGLFSIVSFKYILWK